jgi:hypothetical protein
MTDHKLTTRAGEEIRKGRIAPALRTAIVLLVEEGVTIAEAAQRTGYKRKSLEVALRKGHVRAHRADVLAAWKANQTTKAWHTVAALAQGAQSEDVQLKACRTILEAAGELGRPDGEVGRVAQTLIQIGRITNGDGVTEAAPGVVQIVPGSAEIQRIDVN